MGWFGMSSTCLSIVNSSFLQKDLSIWFQQCLLPSGRKEGVR